jgi:hypothetical protein
MGSRHGCHKKAMEIVLKVVQPAKELALSPAEAKTDGRATAMVRCAIPGTLSPCGGDAGAVDG